MENSHLEKERKMASYHITKWADQEDGWSMAVGKEKNSLAVKTTKSWVEKERVPSDSQ
jgi:hypothetical protein